MKSAFASEARRMLRCLAIVVALCPALTDDAMAQVDTIRAAPNAVMLRHIWAQRGEPNHQLGRAVAALWDIDGDGRDEFAVADVGDVRWRIYGLDELGRARMLKELPLASPDPLLHGDFRGDGRPMLVHPRNRDTAILGRLFYFELYDVEAGGIEDVPAFSWHSRIGTTRLIGVTYHIADLDLDGGDELIVAAGASNRNGSSDGSGEIWIYAGGPNFQLDSPTVVIRDDEYNDRRFDLHIGRLDEDAYPDLLCVTGADGRIRWGGPDLRALDRPVDKHFARPSSFADIADVDGDGRCDLLWHGGYIYLSSSRKDARTRSFDRDDADRVFAGGSDVLTPLGPLNDSANHYDMISLGSGRGDGVEWIFSGGAGGPDARYDAWHSTYADGLSFGYGFQNTMPAGDIDGNGWRDFIAGNDDLFSGDGAAFILGGGPHIPRDSMPASAIRDIAVDGRERAITVWPNPATDEVHVAWRGDIRRVPARVAVHDVLGRLVGEGAADDLRGEVVWRCGERPPGLYLLTLFDRDGAVIATVPVTKR